VKVELKTGCDRFDPRYVIQDDDGKVVDDAQGWGYKSKQKAYKAMWYKFSGGKQKVSESINKKNEFFKQHTGLEKFLNRIYENNFKEIARGEVTDENILEEIKEKFGIDMPKEYLGGPEYKKRK
jgi:thiamine kinase-like enzyme